MTNNKPFLIRASINIDKSSERSSTYNVVWDKNNLVKEMGYPYDFVFRKESLSEVFKQVELLNELNPGLINSITITQL